MSKIVAALMPSILSLIIVVASIPVLKVGRRAIADLSFNGTTATCSLTIVSERPIDSIDVSVQLLCGTEVVADWGVQSAIGTFSFCETASVKKGKTYVMKTTCSINGTSYPILDVTKVN